MIIITSGGGDLHACFVAGRYREPCWPTTTTTGSIGPQPIGPTMWEEGEVDYICLLCVIFCACVRVCVCYLVCEAQGDICDT